MTRCTRCRKDKPLNHFHRNSSKSGGYERQCRDCAAERKLLRRYGITRSQYDQMLENQGGLCLLCHRPPTNGPLVVDHSHTAEKTVRALLCSNCNTGIGLLGENPAVMVRAAHYVGSQVAA